MLLATPLTGVRAVAGGSEPASESPTHFILVRHAEKEAGGSDPALTQAGIDRARALSHILGDTPIHALYASQFSRAQLTLDPLSGRTKLEIQVAPIEGAVEDWARAFAAELKQRHLGETVVVAGHSNTTPFLARALGATAPEMTEKDYDDLYWVTLRGDGSTDHVEFRHLHYGEPSD